MVTTNSINICCKTNKVSIKLGTLTNNFITLNYLIKKKEPGNAWEK